MTISLRPIEQAQRPAFERLFQLYLHDMSQFMRWPVGADGMFAYPQDLLTPYWARDDHWPYFIYADDQIAGFSLARVATDDDAIFDMGQFFTLRAFRGKAVGIEAFHQTVRCHPGQWQVRVLVENTPALGFWTKATAAVAHSGVTVARRDYQQHLMDYYSFSAG
ncbi:GNAT family N-acetyltransferase [Aliiroseovarius sp. CAU 1755]